MTVALLSGCNRPDALQRPGRTPGPVGHTARAGGPFVTAGDENRVRSPRMGGDRTLPIQHGRAAFRAKAAGRLHTPASKRPVAREASGPPAENKRSSRLLSAQ